MELRRLRRQSKAILRLEKLCWGVALRRRTFLDGTVTTANMNGRSMGKAHINRHFSYTAASRTKLLDYLRKQDITVPARTEGRTSQHCEKWAMFRLLATWANANRFEYPLRLVHRNRPDFLLCYAKREIGIESTEAVSQEYAETDALAERMGVHTLLFMDQFRRETPKRSVKERRQLIIEQPYGAGFGDDEPELEWARWIMDCIRDKTNALSKPGFAKFDKNWLLIYDNLPLPFVKIKTALGFLFHNLNIYWSENHRYDGIFIDTGIQLLEIYPTEWNSSVIVNLWSKPS
ncbi:MAG: hypothetical protein JXN61_09685 [Sedimentisphaerales bacterium]|nr:hypothetical protein [Sedimentisphaerales bacterium]